ncbi:methionine synthase [Alicyclobacillus tolerans]|uniref:Methionine synthase n=1 Tax=Alicyclobacillus tolerans TaxID=90970 RepID=A0ABT9LVC1_9BACL|nr:methionine synthase [Alicyclobacillus tengchongensis]MDP9728187.1 5-methyltetrahydrofolate--homocysteine methyltransferase [Alicyclobacillus tengchongensis]
MNLVHTASLQELLEQRILILDGAMGTMIQQKNLTAEAFGGEAYEGCNEWLSKTRPDLIRSIHEEYLAAGADIVSTNTFGSTSIVLAEYGLSAYARELNLCSAKLAREAAYHFSSPQQPRYVAGSMGPTTKSLSLTGGATFAELLAAYEEQALALLEGGVDLLLLETSQDMLNVKAAGLAIQSAWKKFGRRVPVVISGTIEAMGTTLGGQTIDAFYLSVEHLKPLAVGLNCATGPEFMRDHVRTLAELATCSISCYPNAGLPDESGHYHETPESFSRKMEDFAKEGWLNIAGGCCGTTPDHIRALASRIAGYAPRRVPKHHPHAVAGLESVLLEPENRPILVGERTNVIGSRKFRKLIAEGEMDVASDIARAQVRAGAQIIDVCLADPDRDELADMEAFLPKVVRKVRVPLMIDSTDAAVVELALQHVQGKAIINSTNLEDGEPRLAKFAELAKRYGAALVVGTIDEEGMAVSRERKLAIAKRSVQILTENYGLAAEDILIDPLTFPVGTGDEKYIGSAKETIEGIRLIHQELPECPQILGISNVSFGLPPAGREVLNSVFLYHCTKAGLGYAIVNTQSLQRFSSLSDEERQLAEKLLFETSDAVVAEFTAFYREKKQHVAVERSQLSLLERIAHYVVEGSKDGLLPDLEEALQTMTPLEIINGPLMDGMNEVGRLFNNNELIVAEVLQSAEVMKAAVAFLEPRMDKLDSANKGTVILATVKGDVHDIGKNLVEIILSNNGYYVHNLGIKVLPETLIAAAREYHPDFIGLSGLLVKSAQQMVITAEELSRAGITIPLLVGGAALTKKFTMTKIAPAYSGTVMYAKDAMDGLALANAWQDEGTRETLTEQLSKEQEMFRSQSHPVPKEEPADSIRLSDISSEAPVFQPPDLRDHLLRHYPIEQIMPYLNWQMLLGKHLGLSGNVEKRLADGDEKATQLKELVEDVIRESIADGSLQAHAVYQFFPAVGNRLTGEISILSAPHSSADVLHVLQFPRQRGGSHLCLADFLREKGSGSIDYIAMFAVTTGAGIREKADRLKEKGDYLRSHALAASALELAEAFAERVHHMIRDIWGFPDPLEMTMRERFIARYQGIRVSFGYPACPDLEQQETLFALLKPQRIGIQLTDGYMMEPEASVTALVFSHPEARYFNADAE